MSSENVQYLSLYAKEMNLNINQTFSLKWRQARGTLSVPCKHSMKIPLKMYKYFFFFF